MTIQSVNSEIISGAFTNDQLDDIINAVKFARSRLSLENKRVLRIGSRVSWVSTKTGGTQAGTVTKIAQKFVTVSTAAGMWRVPANMLQLEAALQPV